MKVSRLEPDLSGIVNWPTLSTTKKSVVTVGVFDGMHRGHQSLIKRVVELARQQGDYAVVVMFDPSPKQVHSYADAHSGADLPSGEAAQDRDELMPERERLRIMRELGVDWVLSVQYTLAFAAKSFRFFLGALVGKIGMSTLVLGQDATMGAGRAGNVEAIERLAEATGVFTLDIVDDAGPGYTWVPGEIEPQAPAGAGEPGDPLEGMNKAELRAWTKAHQCKKVRIWSSTNVRYLLASGRASEAAAILGHAHAVEGEVVHGEQRGRELGYPTANISEDYEGYMPVDGVYAGWLVDLGPSEAAASAGAGAAGVSGAVSGSTASGGADGTSAADGGLETVTFSSAGKDARLAPGSPWRWPADISIGSKETFAGEGQQYERVLEVNAIVGDDWLDLYGHRVRVEFLAYLRPQAKFASGEALSAQLQQDAADSLRLARQAEAGS
ncbi:bifunctional riboflavin kinase/FMN adenylyltransferase [Bombiscardovia nodaiensis]|uniref:Bifunctional riboflavin kinase/FMN adenylyltransferase n=1 Tax=Bombiscardovia nodaiensis TaxID=2932181 RepID=A0ABM8B6R9_9BIFI|nr:bifunctional riboflavin kinase/FMN adenylyltransferase [Bombiscardovia nodaiensis]